MGHIALAQSLLLLLCSGIILGSTQENIGSAGMEPRFGAFKASSLLWLST